MSDVIFGIAPRINAAGRIDHAKKAVDLLVEKDFNRANLILNEIEKNINNVTKFLNFRNFSKNFYEDINMYDLLFKLKK